MDELEMKYFVLRPRAKDSDDIYACASQNAMCAYANTIRKRNPGFAQSVEKWANRETAAQARLSTKKSE